MNEWDSLYERIRMLEPLHPDFHAKRPSIASISSFEHLSRCQLPLSYRLFQLTFGPGRLSHDIGIRAPNCHVKGPEVVASAVEFEIDISSLNAFVRTQLAFGTDRAHEFFRDPERITRLLYFADNGANDYYGWDLLEPNDEGEYAIYVVERDADESRHLTPSFRSFIFDFCLADGAPWIFSPTCSLE